MALSLIFNSCQKEPEKIVEKEVEKETTLYSSSSIIESDVRMDDEDIMEAVASIKFQANRIPDTDGPAPDYVPMQFSDMDAEHFIFFLEAALNFDFYRSYSNQTGFEKHTASNRVSFVTGSTAFDEATLVDLYDDLVDVIENNIPQGKDALVCNVWIEDVTENDAMVYLEVTYSEDNNQGGPLDWQDDAWWAGGAAGHCNSSCCPNFDAADRLEELTNYYLPSGWNGDVNSSTGGFAVECANNMAGTWTNVFEVQVDGHSTFPNPWDNWPRYLHWQVCWGAYDLELQLIMYNDHFNSLFSSVDHIYTRYYDIEPQLGHYQHIVEVDMGDLNCGPLPW